MQIGFVGLGRMGGNMVHRIRRDSDHEVVAFDPSAEARQAAEAHGAHGAFSLEELVAGLQPPRMVWIMVPAGAPTQQTIDRLHDLLAEGDVIVDGGNSKWTESRTRAAAAREHGLEFIDVGTSGGVWGLEVGYCMMVGGVPDAVGRLAPILDVLAPPDGWGHMGDSGAGHYVKMIHNGVEYGMMQAYAEGFDLMHGSDYGLDMAKIAKLWNHASVVRSWLCELAARAFEAEGDDLAGLEGYVEDSGEGRWTVQNGIDQDVPTPVITSALYARFYSRRPDAYTAKVLAALRSEFGGHPVRHEP
jgi:6-phosphogluconate dehydrogenase